MTKKNRLVLLLLCLVFGVSAVIAQQMPPIPVDDAVRIGTLPNGLTYYIRHNEKPKGQADFYIAQKVGSILEEENQRGLAHFLEHMCFNGTTHFPNSAIIDWLESIGVKFGVNLNAYTGIDQTVYNISNVPIDRTSVQDSCLLILHDWANDLTLDPEEIDKERGVIHQEWRRSMAGTMRVLEKLLPEIYPDSKYGYRLPIGTMEVVDNFPPQALRDYYETWYRPDQQGVVVVGDIDVDYIEGKIKEMFSDIEMPANAKTREYLQVADTPGTIYAIGSDPEVTVPVIELMFKTDAFPNEMKDNVQYMLVQYMVDIMKSMLDQRLTDMGNRPDAPFAQAGASYGNFFVAKTKDALDTSVVPKGNDVLPAFEAMYREILRASRGGFTVTEYERTRDEYLSDLEKKYNGRDKIESESYVNQYVDNFLDNEPIPSIADEYEIMSQLVPMISVDMINQILPELVDNGDNRVLLAIFPEKDGFVAPTADDFAAVIAKVDAEDIEAYKDEMKEEPLIPQLPIPGKVVSVTDDPTWGAKVLTLSNGVTVYVLNTDNKKDQILFTASAIGGVSVIPEEKAASLIFLEDAMSRHGLGDYNSTDMTKYLQGKQVNMDVAFDNYSRMLSGSSTVKDLPTLMELIYMTFMDYNITEDDYAAVKNMAVSMLANQQANPQFVFVKDMYEQLFESPTQRFESVEVVESADRNDILDIVHSMLANAADFTFFFIGDVTVDAITPLLEQYIATLPAIAEKATKDYTPVAAREIRTGTATSINSTKMETPQTWCNVVISGYVPYTIVNKYVSSAMGQILSNRLLKKIREEMGAVYSIGASCNLRRAGMNNLIIQIPFPMKPEMQDEVIAEIDKMLHDMENNVTADELNPIKEYLLKEVVAAKESNSDIASYMSSIALNGVDTFHGAEDVINALTPQNVEDMMRQLLKQGNYRIVVLQPE